MQTIASRVSKGHKDMASDSLGNVCPGGYFSDGGSLSSATLEEKMQQSMIENNSVVDESRLIQVTVRRVYRTGVPIGFQSALGAQGNIINHANRVETCRNEDSTPIIPPTGDHSTGDY